jgi:hypothetical protein
LKKHRFIWSWNNSQCSDRRLIGFGRYAELWVLIIPSVLSV